MKIPELFLRMPKVELHVHLEGSIQPATLLRLARRNGIPLPADTVEGLRDWFAFEDFNHFVEVYVACSKVLRHPEDFQDLVRDFMREQARQNIIYSEAHFTIGTHLMHGANGQEIRDAMWEAIQEEKDSLGVELWLIPDIVRNVPWKWADLTVEWALESRNHGVVALGLAGIEGADTTPFRAHFHAARGKGLHRTVHAGEQEGPESIRQALEICRPERIGHGIRAVEDSRLLDEMVDSQIPFEICPTSNIKMGYAADYATHPIHRLMEAGAVVTVNSDDPPMFEIDLAHEFAALFPQTNDVGLLRTLGQAALDAAFVDDDHRQSLQQRFDEDWLLLS